MSNLAIKYNLKNKSTLKKAESAIKANRAFVFGLSGKMGSGKDTVGETIESKLLVSGVKIHKYSFATPLREEIAGIVNSVKEIGVNATSKKFKADKANIVMLVSIMGDSDIYERSPEARRALQYWGTEYRRAQYPNYWVERVAEFLSVKLAAGESFYITDARFPNEVELVEDFGNAVIRLEISNKERVRRIKKRDGFTPSKESLSHISESLLDTYKFKHVINDDKLSPCAISDIIISDILKKEK